MNTELAQTAITSILAGGGSSILVILIRGVLKWASGKQGREVAKRKSYEERIGDAETDAETEAKKRRKLEEYASRLRRAMFEAGLEPEDWPADSKDPNS